MNRDTFRAQQAALMTEAELQVLVINLARFYGFELVFHPHDSRRSEPGFPDLVLVSTRQRRVLYRELKRQTGRVTPTQQAWLDALTAARQDAAVWRPEDFLAGRITDTLRGTGGAR